VTPRTMHSTVFRRRPLPRKRGSERLPKEVRVNTKFTQPEVWPTPAGRTGQSRLVNRRDNRQHHCAGASRLQTKVCCQPRGHWPTHPRVCATRRQSGSTARPDPRRTNRKGSLRFDSTRESFRRSCVPRTGFAIPRSQPPKRPVCQGFTSVADGALGMALPSTSQSCSLPAARFPEWRGQLRAGAPQGPKSLRGDVAHRGLRDRSLGIGIVLRLTPKAAS